MIAIVASTFAVNVDFFLIVSVFVDKCENSYLDIVICPKAKVMEIKDTSASPELV